MISKAAKHHKSYLWYVEEFDQYITSTTPKNKTGFLAMTVCNGEQEFIVRAEFIRELKDERLREKDQSLQVNEGSAG